MIQTILFTQSGNNLLPPLDERAPSSLLPMVGKNKLVFWVEHCYRAGLRELIIVSPEWQLIKTSIGDGTQYGVAIRYCERVQEADAGRVGWCINADLLVDFDSSEMNNVAEDGLQIHVDNELVALVCSLPLGEVDFQSLITQSTIARKQSIDGKVLPMITVQDFHANVINILDREYDSLLPAGLVDETSPKLFLNGAVKWNKNSLKAGSFYCGAGTQIDKSVNITSTTAIEKDCFIDKEARISNTVVLTGSYVGKMTEVENSIVWGRLLIRVDTDTVIKMPDDQILADQTRREQKQNGIRNRLSKWFKPT